MLSFFDPVIPFYRNIRGFNQTKYKLKDLLRLLVRIVTFFINCFMKLKKIKYNLQKNPKPID